MKAKKNLIVTIVLLAIYLAVVLLLTGCETLVWHHPAKSYEETKLDFQECKCIADGSVTWLTEVVSYVNSNEVVTRQCMMEKGYRQVPLSSVPPDEPVLLISGTEVLERVNYGQPPNKLQHHDVKLPFPCFFNKFRNFC